MSGTLSGEARGATTSLKPVRSETRLRPRGAAVEETARPALAPASRSSPADPSIERTSRHTEQLNASTVVVS
ncbi:hypothetical protein ACGFWE_22730 [Streptomyces sp. NPDC048523]|uniref:hypothetical protein n=1 Tax=Streptomyces sp. NPDC048523 TaxID=3365567 RepID=UPI00371DE7F1